MSRVKRKITRFRDEVLFKEDRLYDVKVRDLILGLHGWEFVAERRHLVVADIPPMLEADVVIAARTPHKGELRYIGIELKEGNFMGVLMQAIKKTPLFHVVYVVSSTLYITKKDGLYDALDALRDALNYGVGIILYRDECSRPVLITHAKINKTPNACFKLQRGLNGALTISFEGIE